jgi:hypothetical protein
LPSVNSFEATNVTEQEPRAPPVELQEAKDEGREMTRREWMVPMAMAQPRKGLPRFAVRAAKMALSGRANITTTAKTTRAVLSFLVRVHR